MRVLISGAGIAGPALAHWLHRHGIEPVVVEQAPGPRPGGHAVDLRGVARDVAERMGIMPAVEADRVDERGIALVNRRGRRIGGMPADLFGGEGIVAEIEIARGDLSRILYDATVPYTDYRFGDRIMALTQDASGVDVTFRSGTTERFDVVVGADGVHSGVRALAFGPESDFVQYLGGYGAYFTVPDPGDLDHWFLLYNAPGGLVAGLRPERGGTAKASLTFRSPDLGRLAPAAQQQVLRERMTGAGWRVDEFLAAMPSADDFYFDSICQVHVGQWHRNRVVLLGDAGYCGSPLAGLGTSAALVAAYVLAGELARSPGDPEAAFAAYQSKLTDYVATAQELPPGGMKMFAPRSRLVIALRALSWRMMTRRPMRGIMEKQAAKADRITLPDYAEVNSPNASR
jgi:2-polyprenyl-6-methoxyphenol hydroxylase-like FAD-dependent oxidoreductase